MGRDFHGDADEDMNLLVISHKETWPDPIAPLGISTVGGFAFQMGAIAPLFNQTRLVLTQPPDPAPGGLIPFDPLYERIIVLPTPTGGRWHKLRLIPWFLRHLPLLWREIARADAVHTPVPGDVGSLGLALALIQRKPLFVRHCGTWGEPVTLSDRLLLWLLERIAGGRNVVLATGGGESPPSAKNPNIRWIFSTSLTQAELDSIQPAVPWDGRAPLRLVSVGRLTHGKNMSAILEALPALREKIPNLRLDILGEGEARPYLEKLTSHLQLSNHVTFHGNVSHARVLEILSRSHLFVFPTRTKEGFPKAVLEALACGLPVIATRVSVIPQLLQNGAGLLLEETSALAVVRAVLQLTADPARMARMGQLARQAAQGYTLEAWGQTIGEHLQKAWGQPLRSPN
jgi:glycosyltransferase involved in cell wall biosynthesis